VAARTYRAPVHAIWWYDIVGDGSWGKASPLSLCVTIGVILERPSNKQKPRPFYCIYDSLNKDDPGGGSTIPESVVRSVKPVGHIALPYPVPTAS
jgi:hypothetical protein